MIIVKLKGGLGNQLFQYAAGLSLSKRTGRELFIDTSFLDRESVDYTKRNFELGQFRRPHQILRSDTVLQSQQRSFFDRLTGRANYKVLNESNINDSWTRSQTQYLLVEGYFQSEIYFSDVRPDLLKYVEPSASQAKQLAAQKHEIINSLSVGLHVRRGDYVSLDSANAFHGVCTAEYFHKAMKYIASVYPAAVFFVFSDDLDWCRQNIRSGNRTIFADKNHDFSGADMLLMSYCRHNIISNSSYSWWSAWLNQCQDKIVIAPEKWYAESSMNSENIYGKNWLRF